MKTFITRDWDRTEHDDYALNVEPRLSERDEVLPVVYEGEVVAWEIGGAYE